jgi:hypothetical protein
LHKYVFIKVLYDDNYFGNFDQPCPPLISEHVKNEWASSNESVSSVVGSSGSITPKPHSLKSSTKSSFEVSSQPWSGPSMIGPVVNLPLAAPSKGDGLQRISSSKQIAE